MSNVVFGDRAQETTTTQGTGTYSLAGAAAGKQSLVDAVKEITGDLVGPWVVEYFVADNVDWEIGVGTLTDATPDTLARTSIIDSSNAGSAVNWGAGTRNVVLAPGSRRLMSLPGMAAETELTIAAGAIAPRFGTHRVDTEADAASDDLDTIGQGHLQDGAWLLLGAADAARVVTVRHNQGTTGKILTADSANVTLDATTKYLLLQRVDTTWVERGRFGFAATLIGTLSPAQITADQNDYSPTGLSGASTLRLSTDASRNLTGLATGGDGRLVLIHNVGANALVLKGESASSTAANRFALPADVTLNADDSVMLRYDGTSSRWRLAGKAASGLPTGGTAGQILLKQSATDGDASWASAQIGRNAVINGGFDIWQRGTSFTSIADGTYAADRWRWVKSATGAVHDVSRSTDVPTVAEAGQLFNYSLLADCTTADAAVAAGDLVALFQRIEGFNWLPLAQRAITLSFWVKATKTGTYCVALHNSGADRCYVGEYTVNVADTWERKTVTISASPSAGTWDYTTGVGITLAFVLMAGSTYNGGTASTWNSADVWATANQVNACDNVANNFRLCGVQLEAGSIATPFERRSIQRELALCQRYYWRGQGNSDVYRVEGYASGASQGISNSYLFPVEMRASPTLAVTGTWTLSNLTGPNISGTQDGFQLRGVSSAAGPCLLQANGTDDYITASAEL